MEKVEQEQSRPIVKKLKELMVLRNTHPAFSLEGTIGVVAEGDILTIKRTFGEYTLTLNANLTTYDYTIE